LRDIDLTEALLDTELEDLRASSRQVVEELRTSFFPSNAVIHRFPFFFLPRTLART